LIAAGSALPLPTTRTGLPLVDVVVPAWECSAGAEQGYKQVKDELFQVRSDAAIRRHRALVSCAFSFRWAAWFADHPPAAAADPDQPGQRKLLPAALHPELTNYR
jgi:hypothetical protein